MSFNEVFFFRIPQFLQLNILGRLQANQKIKLLSVLKDTDFQKYDLKTIKQMFKETPFDDKFHFFNTEVSIFKVNNWRKDYHNKIISPLNYYNNINKQDFELNGDIKFLAEIGRLQFLPFIAFKAVESDDKVYINKIESILDDWNLQNPYLKSIHWTSGIEVAIRSVNLVFTYHILRCFKLLPQTLEEAIRRQLSYSYQFLKNHLSLHSSANNHLMAELMGLNVIASYFKVSKKHRQKWQEMFFKEVQNQVNEDGVHMELCTRYHAEVLDQVLIAVQFLKRANVKIPSAVNAKLESMFLFTEHVSYHGIETIFGDNDEGFVIDPYFVEDFSLYQSQLSSSNYLYNTTFNSNGKTDFRNYLIFGEDFRAKAFKTLPKTTFFRSSGYCFIYNHKNHIKFSFDVGKIGDDISSAHGHSDIFHFNLQQGNQEILIDPGTFQYHQKDLFWRNYFRGITAHNTISINNQHHALPNNRMSWTSRPQTPITEFLEEENRIFCKSEHYAFKDIIHQRSVDFSLEIKKIVIRDTVINKKQSKSSLGFYLQFHPSTELKVNNKSIIIKTKRKDILIENSLFENAEIIEGNESLPLGWYSKTFNVKQKSKSLRLLKDFKSEVTLETIIVYD